MKGAAAPFVLLPLLKFQARLKAIKRGTSLKEEMGMKLSSILCAAAISVGLAACDQASDQKMAMSEAYDTIIKNGTIYDGSGQKPYQADLAIKDDRIVKIGDLGTATATTMVDATGKAVSPGFINMLSWATDSLVTDGRGVSDLVQGVTTEVFGEGWTMGPYTPEAKARYQKGIDSSRTPYKVQWDTLGQYLEFLEKNGVSPNVASYVGATTVRINHVGFDDRSPTDEEMTKMKADVRFAMEEGAMGLGSSLIYAPAFYAKTDELVELAKVVGEYGGGYISHMRSEGNQLFESIDELITIAREAGIWAEIYHLKAAGRQNWDKMDQASAMIEAARADGVNVTADMYTYTAGGTGLNATMPPWVQEGGYGKWVERLKDPAIRKRVAEEMKISSDDWENLGLAAGPDGLLFANFLNPDLRKYIGKTLTDVAADRGTSIEDTLMDLVVENGADVDTIYFLMSEDNVKKQLTYPWMSFGSDAAGLDPAVHAKFGSAHPRTYGNFVRVLGKYSRDEGVLPLEDAVYKLSGLPATNLKIKDRGFLKEGYYADVVVFDPATVTDHATYQDPHQLSTGVEQVFVNGGHVVKDGHHTGATPGRVVRGPGWTGWKK